ncbi:hypothetical protein, partial [Streptomyces sp. NPDC058291]|uniref:hypothetical protein n=1 Tax=Streptomyces sp. NPDC058291 TaxID=3346427 RepID=UPI0036E3A3C7
ADAVAPAVAPAVPGDVRSPGMLPALQRTAGNAAVVRALEQQRQQPRPQPQENAVQRHVHGCPAVTRTRPREATDKYDAFPRGDTAPTPRIAKWKADNGGAPTAAVAEKLKPAHPTAPMAYTGGAHQMINSVGRSRLLPEGYAPYGLGSLACAGAEAMRGGGAAGRRGGGAAGRRGGGGNPHTWARAPLRAAFLAGNNGDAAG